MAQVLCFGDSITYGMWGSQGGWVARLRKGIDKQIADSKHLIWHEVFNLGISGNFTSDLLARVVPETTARLLIEPEALAVVAIGLNDTKYSGASGISTPEQYQKQLENIHRKLSKLTKAQIYIGLTPIDESTYGANRIDAGKEAFSNQRIQEFDAVLAEHCRRTKATYIPLFDNFMRHGYTKLLSDGIHPNDAGHKLIYQQIKPVVWRQLNLV